MANSSLQQVPQNPQARQFLICQVCGQGIMLAPEGSTPATSFTCRNCNPRPQSGPTFDTFHDNADTRELMARYEADRDSRAGTDYIE